MIPGNMLKNNKKKVYPRNSSMIQNTHMNRLVGKILANAVVLVLNFRILRW